ncbi:hypothetical protein [Frigoribacterium sp. CFBP 13707]|uniref:hypothetical protein n=1 Tax=Frigoribacterium sp. CFBP 13707 TaxID=2775313 RepID=UPI0017825A4F|nr:hypothetical protein [Frigoribacterium sp. CFBP 13707]MBD8728323.1 hypothetical protein [Frigoribacterium sp. CFBP 13707]
MSATLPRPTRPAQPHRTRDSHAPRPAVDPAGLMLVDIATGRYLPGDEIDAQVVAREHGLRPVDVRIALYDLRRAGLVTGVPFSGTRVVVWHRRTNEALMRRLGRVLAGVAAASPVLEALPEPAETRLPAADLLVRHGLALPADVEHFLDLARTMVDTLPADERVRVHSELLLPLTVLSTTTALHVHGVVPALPEGVRGAIVDLVEAAAHYGDWADVPGLVADYTVALGADEPRSPGDPA